MPDMDKTGPYGTGRFGRGMGSCGDHPHGHWHTRHIHRGLHFGRGWLHRTISSDEEKEWLEQRKSWLETQLTAINERLQELASKQPDSTN